MSDKDVLVVTSCSERGGLLPLLEQQLAAAGIPLEVIIKPVPEGGTGNSGTLGSKTTDLLWYADKFRDYRYLIFSDAWDVAFYGNKADLLWKLKAYCPIGVPMFAAERNCWPDSYLACCISGTTPWRFYNGGLLAGTPDTIMEWANTVRSHPAYVAPMIDQQWCNQRLVLHDPLVHIDSPTDLFYCAYEDMGELTFKNGQPLNQLTGTRPMFLHFNGRTSPTRFQLLWALSKIVAEVTEAKENKEAV